MTRVETDHPLLARLGAFAVGVGVAYAAFSYEGELNVRRPPVLGVRASRVARVRGPSGRVVWVLVDGLRLDASRKMTALNALRGEGVDVSGRAEFPTFSGPNFVAQASGIEPAASGVLSNSYPGETELDSVFQRAKMARLRTALLTTDPDPGLGETYASWIDDTDIDDPDPHLPTAQLVFMHMGFVDEVAHDYGTLSPEYRAAVARADDVIGRIARTLDPARETLVVTSDHGNLDEGGHGGTERVVVRVPIVIWGAGLVRPTRRAGRGRDVGPTIASLLGVGPLAHATGRPLVRGDAVTARQRVAARAVVRASGRLRVDHVPMMIPIAVVGLLLFNRGAWPAGRPLVSAPTYALVFTGLLLATHTLSFSVSNLSAFFGARLTTLSALAALAQLYIGGRCSLTPAAFAASLAVLGAALVAAHQPLAPADGTLRFLPIPALTGLAFVCLTAAAIGRKSGRLAGAERQFLGDHAAADLPRREPDPVECALPDLSGVQTSGVHGSR